MKKNYKDLSLIEYLTSQLTCCSILILRKKKIVVGMCNSVKTSDY